MPPDITHAGILGWSVIQLFLFEYKSYDQVKMFCRHNHQTTSLKAIPAMVKSFDTIRPPETYTIATWFILENRCLRGSQVLLKNFRKINTGLFTDILFNISTVHSSVIESGVQSSQYLTEFFIIIDDMTHRM